MIQTTTLLLAILLVVGCRQKTPIEVANDSLKRVQIKLLDTVAKAIKPKRDPMAKLTFYLDIMSKTRNAQEEMHIYQIMYETGESKKIHYTKARKVYDSLWIIYDSARIDLTKNN